MSPSLLMALQVVMCVELPVICALLLRLAALLLLAWAQTPERWPFTVDDLLGCVGVGEAWLVS